MAHIGYVTKDLTFSIVNVKTTPLKTAIEKSAGGECLLDYRTGLVLEKQDNGEFHPFNMQLYYNYVRSCRDIMDYERVDNAKAMAYMGFLPLVCEPTFTGGIYGKILEPVLKTVPLRVYRRAPMSFSMPASSLPGVDIWASKLECFNLLKDKMTGVVKPEQVTVQSVYSALGVQNVEKDFRELKLS